ncbi:MAG: hypothetical protein AAGB15_11540 [Pseudomonadota bacterium]
MDKTLFICGFALVMGVWNVWSFRNNRIWWFWVGLAMIAFGIVVLVLEKVLNVPVFYQV